MESKIGGARGERRRGRGGKEGGRSAAGGGGKSNPPPTPEIRRPCEFLPSLERERPWQSPPSEVVLAIVQG